MHKPRVKRSETVGARAYDEIQLCVWCENLCEVPVSRDVDARVLVCLVSSVKACIRWDTVSVLVSKVCVSTESLN